MAGPMCLVTPSPPVMQHDVHVASVIWTFSFCAAMDAGVTAWLARRGESDIFDGKICDESDEKNLERPRGLGAERVSFQERQLRKICEKLLLRSFFLPKNLQRN